MTDTYEDKLDQIMEFVTMRMNSRGVRVKVRNTQDLRNVIQDLDENTKHKGKGRITSQFLDAVERKGGASRFVGATIGSRGPVTTVGPARRPERPVAPRKRVVRRGVRRVMFNIKGVNMERFRDARTGRFVSKSFAVGGDGDAESGEE